MWILQFVELAQHFETLSIPFKNQMEEEPKRSSVWKPALQATFTITNQYCYVRLQTQDKKQKENGKMKICMVATWLGFQAAGLSQHIRMQIFRF